MKYNLSENIKTLRKQRNITQERMAEYLNVSYQSISKWENGITLPNVTLLPSIANLFGVSIDELYDIDRNASDAEIDKYLSEYEKLCAQGKNEERVKLMRQALAEYPRNFKFICYLARSLYRCKGADRYSDEIISLCERILEECTDEVIKASALQTLARTYNLTGDKAKALEYAMRIPTMRQAREFVLAEILDGEDKIRQLQENLFFFAYNAGKEITYLAGNKRGMGKELSFEDKIRMYEAANAIYKAVADDGNYLILNGKLYWHYNWIAENHSMLGDTEKAMSYLIKAETAAREIDRFIENGKQMNYTSIFLNRVYSNPKGVFKHWQGSHCRKLLEMLQSFCYDNMRDMAEFKELELRLEHSC